MKVSSKKRPAVPVSGGKVSGDKVRVGVIGLGMGRAHLAGYKACPECEIVALCDLDEERLNARGDEFGVARRFASYEEMLAMDDLDAVSVALPNFLHDVVTRAAFAAGKHVLCEKPMAMTVAGAESMVRAAAEAERKLMMHFNFRFTPQAQLLKKYVDAGELGEIYFARTGWHRRRGMPGMGGWFCRRSLSGGGPLIDLGVHRLDLALWLMGNPEPVEVMGSTYAKFGPEIARQRGVEYSVEDLACGIVRLANGSTIIVEASWACNTDKSEEMFTVLYGDKGGAEQRNVGEGYDMGLRIFRPQHGVMEDVTPKGIPPVDENPQAHFVSCILRDMEPMATGHHGVQVQKILNGLYRSAETGSAVRLVD